MRIIHWLKTEISNNISYSLLTMYAGFGLIFLKRNFKLSNRLIILSITCNNDYTEFLKDVIYHFQLL